MLTFLAQASEPLDNRGRVFPLVYSSFQSDVAGNVVEDFLLTMSISLFAGFIN